MRRSPYWRKCRRHLGLLAALFCATGIEARPNRGGGMTIRAPWPARRKPERHMPAAGMISAAHLDQHDRQRRGGVMTSRGVMAGKNQR